MDFRNCFKGDFTAIVVVVNVVIGIVVKIIPKTDIIIFSPIIAGIIILCIQIAS